MQPLQLEIPEGPTSHCRPSLSAMPLIRTRCAIPAAVFSGIFSLLATSPVFTVNQVLAASDDVQSEARKAASLQYFEASVRPLLVKRCVGCHGGAKQQGGLRLDSAEGWLKGGDRGPALISGDPSHSLMITAVSYTDDDLRMPPDQKLSPEEITVLQEWIKKGAEGAPDAPHSSVQEPADDWETVFQERLNWWSLQPLQHVLPAPAEGDAWSAGPLDRLILNSLRNSGLAPAEPAEPHILFRRLSFVLTGLPPTMDEQDAFIDAWSVNSEVAWEQAVDRFLASPHFGERFARHWMDVVRYSDTYGYESDNPANGAYEYRDYLIRAFNQDAGFDQMVREQLAGDLLANPRINPELALNESIIGPMFFHLGENREGGSLMFNGIHQQMIDNRIDALSKAFLATTVACARCHDHKLEAVSQRDYYQLAAVLMTPRWTARVIDAPGKNDSAIETLTTLRQAIRNELAGTWRSRTGGSTGDQNRSAWSADELKRSILTKTASAATAGQPPESAPQLPDLRPEEVAWPLVQLMKAESQFKSADDVIRFWKGMSDVWNELKSARSRNNSRHTILADFGTPSFPEGWVTEGDGMQHGYTQPGTPLISLTGPKVVERLLDRGYHTHALSSKLPGALRMPPQHMVPGKRISLLLAGGEFGGYLTIQGNGFKSEQNGFLKSSKSAWKSFSDATLSNGVQQVTVEFATTSLNPNFPPRIGLSDGLPYSDPGYDKRSWLSVMKIVAHDDGDAPEDTLEHLTPLFGSGTPAPTSAADAYHQIGLWLTNSLKRWCEGATVDEDVRILNWLIDNDLLLNAGEPDSHLAKLTAEYRQAEQSIEFSRTATGMDERKAVRAQYPIDIRGDVDRPGELVTPDFLKMFSGRNDVAASSGSGRLELAESLLRPDHPLTSRVFVNRVWQWVFGTGIVATPDDFGHMGIAPAHPELLDFLAREFQSDEWSVKRLVRRLVMSKTFRQGSKVSEAAAQTDPDNRLLHHYPTRRLEAESIRDSLLAVSGRLDPALYGRPIPTPRVLEDTKNKRLVSGPLDGHGRRSLYLQLSIMDPPKFLVGFNLPDLKLPAGRRDVTNVPGQALFMMNDPLVMAMSAHWATMLIGQKRSSPEERITIMFRTAFGRPPNDVELRRWTASVRKFAEDDQGDMMQQQTAWARLAHAVFNTREFLYYR